MTPNRGCWRTAAHLRRRACRVGDTEEVEHQRQDVGEPGIEQQHAAGDLLARGAVVIVAVDAEVAAEQLEDGQEGNALLVRDAVGLVDRSPGRGTPW